MPLDAMQRYCADLINGAAIEIYTGAPVLDAWITPPAVQSMDGPHAYVWGGRVSPVRQTMPRTQGFKKYPWQISIYLVFETTADRNKNPDLDRQFPQLIDAVTGVFATTTMPLIYLDVETGVYSQIQAVGESWTLDYPVSRAPATLRMVWFSALITMDVLEVVQQ